ncbi:MAG: hypothetical protein KDK33_18905, partial [Leptospiraceae bacterium]|nr:hypothetical protein [Leptospiraceae bacterium]
MTKKFRTFGRALGLIFLLAPLAARADAPQGILDLSQEDLTKIHNLDGKWAFYWEKLIRLDEPSMMGSPDGSPPANRKSPSSEQSFPPSSMPQPDTYIPVPGNWNGLKLGETLTGKGFATYGLRVLLPENHPPL